MNEEATVVCAFCGLAPYKEFHGATRLHWTRNDCIAALRSALAEAKLNAGNFAVIQPGQSVADAVPTYEAMAAELAEARLVLSAILAAVPFSHSNSYLQRRARDLLAARSAALDSPGAGTRGSMEVPMTDWRTWPPPFDVQSFEPVFVETRDAHHGPMGATTYKTFVMPDGKTYQTMTGNGGGSWRVVETSGGGEG